ncbi:MAG: molecular chaperone TorD family protein [Deltaproteobacteria bacterium]|nr:molecular chaperone TorD family protein [Deltaproteobacteria bacterium]
MAHALNYPDNALVESLVRGDFADKSLEALDALGMGGLTAGLQSLRQEYGDPGIDPAALLLEIEKDYTRMCFASKPRLVYLFESVYKEGKLYDESTFRIARLYYDAGLKMEEAFTLPPDHIAVELEFLSFLNFKQAEAIRSGDRKIEDYAIELQKKVLEEHLCGFALSLSERLGAHARTNFFRTVAGVMQAFFSGPVNPV